MSLPENQLQAKAGPKYWWIGLIVGSWIILSIGVLFVAAEFSDPDTFFRTFFFVSFFSACGYYILYFRHGLIMFPIIMLAGMMQCGGCLHFIGVRSTLSSPARHQCRSQLELIGELLSDYHDRHGTFPPAYVADKQGRPLYSWTVPIVPWIDEFHPYRELHLDEPWNSPHNKRFTDISIHMFQCPVRKLYRYNENNHIGYVGVVGPETAWPGAVGRPLAEFTDGPATTILLFEVAALDIPWAAPPTLDLDQAIELFKKGDPHGPSSRHYPANISVLFADGKPGSLPPAISPETLRALLTVSGGETIVIPPPLKESSLP